MYFFIVFVLGIFFSNKLATRELFFPFRLCPNQIFIASATPEKRKSRFGIFPERVIFFFSFLFCRCQFPSGALTGNLNVDHAMCVLSLNIINDKIFLLEWLWFYILALASTASLISSAILVILPPSRKLWLRYISKTTIRNSNSE